MSRTHTANRILHTARTLLAEHAAGRVLSSLMLDWAKAIVASNGEIPIPCSNCDNTGDVHSLDGEWRGRCFCLAGRMQVGPIVTTLELGHHSPARAFSGVDIDAVHRNPRWA